jgi:very-short-patch-repair endonuclease
MGTSGATPIHRSPRTGRARGEKVAKNDTCPPGVVPLVDGRRVSVDSALPIDVRIRQVAEVQRGRVARRQLLVVGIDTNAIVRRLRKRRLEFVHRGVYGLPHTADLPLAAETAALLACGEGAVLSHHSAATLWGLRTGTARPVHVTIDGHRGCPAPDGVRVHRSTTLRPADIELHRGLPITSPARTLLDVAAALSDRDVERMLDEGLFALRILTRKDIEHVLARAGGHPGRATLARAAAAAPTPAGSTDSPPEERLLQLIRAAGLPEPRTQIPMLGYRLDFFWPRLKLAVEVDAYGTHGSRARFEADRRRDARLLTEKGIVVIRFSRAAITQRPFEVLGLLARAIGQRETALAP